MLDLGLVAGALVTILWYERRRILSWPAWSRRAPTSDDAPLAQADTPVRATPDASEAVAADREAAGDRAVAAALGSWSHAAGSCCKAATAVDALAEAAEAALESIEEASVAARADADAPVEIETRELAASAGGAASLRRARRPSRIDTSFAGRRAARLSGIDIPVAGAASAGGPDPDLSPLLGDDALAALQCALADAPPQSSAAVSTSTSDTEQSSVAESEPVPPLSRRAATLPQRPCRLIQEYAALNDNDMRWRLDLYFRNYDRAVQLYGEPHTWDMSYLSTFRPRFSLGCGGKKVRLNDDDDDGVAWGPVIHQHGDRLLYVPDVEPDEARFGYVLVSPEEDGRCTGSAKGGFVF